MQLVARSLMTHQLHVCHPDTVQQNKRVPNGLLRYVLCAVQGCRELVQVC